MRALLLTLVACACHAGTATLTWTVATQNTDGSTITGPVTYNLYSGAQGAVKPLLIGNLSALTYVATGLKDGTTVCFNVTAVVNAIESPLSNEACKLLPLPVPAPPTLTVAAVTAYYATPELNAYKMVAVGTVKTDTKCITTQSVDGLYVVPRAAVKWSGSLKPEVVVAKCAA